MSPIGEVRCWRCGCGRLYPVPQPGTNRVPRRRLRPWFAQFSLRDALGLLTLLSISFAVMSHWPLGGWFLVLVAVPAAARTLIAVKDRGPEDGKLTIGIILGYAAASVLFAILSAAAALVAAMFLSSVLQDFVPGVGQPPRVVAPAVFLSIGLAVYLFGLKLTWPS
jgi:hypothetical protein